MIPEMKQQCERLGKFYLLEYSMKNGKLAAIMQEGIKKYCEVKKKDDI